MTQEEANKLNNQQAINNGNEYAFPSENIIYYPGMTKREYIIMQLLTGNITDNSQHNDLMIQEAIRVTNQILIQINKSNQEI